MNNKIISLFGLYCAQGSPLGFALFALPAIFRTQGVDMKVIGLIGLSMLPWAFKFIWASFIENNRPRTMKKLSPGIAWIQQLKTLSLLTIIIFYFLSPNENVWSLLLLTTLLNILYASQDIAVDALAINTFAGNRHVKTNVSQVAGFSLGMLLGGACSLYLFSFGWSTTVSFLLLVQVLCHIPFMMNLKEFNQKNLQLKHRKKASLWRIFNRRAWIPIMLMAILFKMASTMGASLVSPLLVDMGVSLEKIAILSGSVLLISYIAGAIVSGLLHRWFSSIELSITGLLGSAFCWLGITTFLYFFTNQSTPVFIFFILEGFFFNLCCVSLFCWFMCWSEGEEDKGVIQPSTDFTLLQCFEVLGSTTGMILSGLITYYFGFVSAFGVATIFAFGIVVIIYYCFQFSKEKYQGFKNQLGVKND